MKMRPKCLVYGFFNSFRQLDSKTKGLFLLNLLKKIDVSIVSDIEKRAKFKIITSFEL